MTFWHGVTTGGSASMDANICNCACQRCVFGSCCQLPPDPETWQGFARTWTTTAVSTEPSVWTCGAIDHDFAVLDPARLYCRKCGTTRNV